MRAAFWATSVLCMFMLIPAIAQCQESEYEEGLSYYRMNKLELALPHFRQSVLDNQSNPAMYAWLAETLRRLGRKSEAMIAARKALALDPCNSFAHLTLADLENPTYEEWEGANEDSSWSNVMEALSCDSSDGNVWVDVWVNAIKRDSISLMEEAARQLISTGFLTPTVLSNARWLLRALPRNAVLITNGDMDTFPLSAVQVAENFRSDVAVVNRSLLNTSWYERYVRDVENVPLPYPDKALDTLAAIRDSSGIIIYVSDLIIHEWFNGKLKGSFVRPLAVSCTVDPKFIAPDSVHLDIAGPFLIWTAGQRAEIIDTSYALASLAGVQPAEFEGMWTSMQDRSSVRISQTKYNVSNVLYCVALLSSAMMQSHNYGAASYWINWADDVNRKCELGMAYSQQIEELKKELKELQH